VDQEWFLHFADALDCSIDSNDGEYEGQSQESQERHEGQEEHMLEQCGDDKDLFAD